MFTKIIRIPGKTFDDLSMQEVALMIEADSALSPEGNEYFSSSALDEFLYTTEVTREDLKAVRAEILENIYLDVEGSSEKDINVGFLEAYAAQLKQTLRTRR